MSERTLVEVSEVKFFFREPQGASHWDDVYRKNIESRRLRSLTDLNREDFQDLLRSLDSLRNTGSRNRAQALDIFLTKMRTGDSDEYIAAQ